MVPGRNRLSPGDPDDEEDDRTGEAGVGGRTVGASDGVPTAAPQTPQKRCPSATGLEQEGQIMSYTRDEYSKARPVRPFSTGKAFERNSLGPWSLAAVPGTMGNPLPQERFLPYTSATRTTRQDGPPSPHRKSKQLRRPWPES